MAFLPFTGSEYPNLVNVAKVTDPDGKIAQVAELLSETNEILDDAVYVEGNLPTGHKHTVRSDIPSGTWRKLNYGVKPTKSGTNQITDTIGLLEDRSEIDVEIANLNGNSPEFRLQEDQAHIEGMSQDLATAIFYADTADDPEQPLGLAPRYYELGDPSNKPTANSYLDHVIDLGGTTADSQTSIWLICWSSQTVFMIYPKGSTAGIEMNDLGEIDAFDDDGGRFRALATQYKVKCGLAVKDWRYIVRIANIETDMTLDAAGINLITDAMIDATNAIPMLGKGRSVFYMNRATKSMLEKAAVRKSNMQLGFGDIYGVRNQLNISNIPIKQCDAILQTEAVLT
jgi:hypothetical protein